MIFLQVVILLKALEHTALTAKYLFIKRNQIENVSMTQMAEKKKTSLHEEVSFPALEAFILSYFGSKRQLGI